MEDNAKTGKKGLVAAIAAMVALVVVLAGGYFAYQQLTAGASPSAGRQDMPLQTAGSGSAAGSARDDDAIWLADYDATVYDGFGGATTLTRIADGRPLVINFWATWCTYCVREMDDYQQLYDEYGDRVSFAFVDCVNGSRETADMAAAWLLDNGYDLPAYYDNRQEAQTAFGITGLPTTVIVGRDGEILTIATGQIDPDLMREALDTVLGA